jgi:hypothetical protein
LALSRSVSTIPVAAGAQDAAQGESPDKTDYGEVEVRLPPLCDRAQDAFILDRKGRM